MFRCSPAAELNAQEQKLQTILYRQQENGRSQPALPGMRGWAAGERGDRGR